MQRFAPYLGIVAALIFGALLWLSSSEKSAVPPPVVSPALSVQPSPAAPTTPTPEVTTVPPATSVQAPKAVVPKTTPPTPAPITAVPVATPAPQLPSGAFDASASALRDALVNIVCYTPVGSPLHSISGSGVIIDPKGIILTNAHVAQYFLLADRGASCTIRTGAPATSHYQASLIYISPAWLQANAVAIMQASPSGTGEFDFAFLAITKSTTSAPVPLSFPYVPLAIQPPTSGAPVIIATYGAQFLQSSQIQSSLYPTVVYGSVKDVFTFARTSIDVLALGGSAAAQEGSSGGGVASGSGQLVGTITTSTVEGDTSTRSLDAITASYIRGEYASETGRALDLLLAESTENSVNNFASQMPALEALITAQLP